MRDVHGFFFELKGEELLLWAVEELGGLELLLGTDLPRIRRVLFVVSCRAQSSPTCGCTAGRSQLVGSFSSIVVSFCSVALYLSFSLSVLV